MAVQVEDLGESPLLVSLLSVGDRCCQGIIPQMWQFSKGLGSEPAFLLSCRVERIRLNATNTFLVYTEEDLGDLLKIRLTWKRAPQSWYSLWTEFRSYLSQSRKSEQEVNIRRIRVKSGETQRK